MCLHEKYTVDSTNPWCYNSRVSKEYTNLGTEPPGEYMADNKVTIDLQIASKGMDPAVQKSQAIRDNLTAAGGAMSRVGGGTAGSRAVSEKAAGQEYAAQRGVAGATGASARNFAAESQGLGGLVRLYATFAANTYAAAAAFKALSTAMDTANMVKGLDQLGAASGTALGSLSKRLVDATGGAVSLREAMEATAKASSSGISSENILRLGKVAQQASQALGVDATDALSRLTRGVTKLEPELLDELGIFTKIEPAVEKYAKSVGKATSELTDFERRLAFTLGALEEGEQKFSNIKLDTNPYNQLSATLKNLLQSGLEVINTVLAPIAKFLAESPLALGVSLAAFAGILIKQAIPAIGQFRAGLQQVADDAQDIAVNKGKEAQDARKKVDAAILADLESVADARVATLDAAEEKVQNINAKSVSRSSLAYKLLKTDIVDVTREQIKAVEERAKIAEKEGRGDQAKAYREIAVAVREHKDAEDALLAGKKQLSEQYEKDSKGLTTFGLTLKAAEAAEKSAAKSRVISNAAYNSSLIGTSGATKLARAELEKLGITLTKVETLMLKARIGVAVLAGALSTLGAVINKVFAVVGTVTILFTIFDSLLSKNSKQMSEFSSSVDRANKSVETLGDTFDNIGKKPLDQMYNTESMKAISTAIMEISDSTAELIKNTEKLEKASSPWDNLLDSLKKAWGGDRQSKFAETITESTLGALNELGDRPEAVAAKKKIAGILNIDFSATTAQWEKAYKSVYGNKTALREIDQTMKGVATSFGIAASKLEEFDTSLKKTADAQKSFLDKFKVKDELALLGEEFLTLGIKTAEAFKSPETAVKNLSDIAQDNKLLSLFGTKTQTDLLKYKDELVSVNKVYNEQKRQLEDLQTQRNKLEAGNEEVVSVSEITGEKTVTFKNADELAAIAKQIDDKTAALTTTFGKISELAGKFPNTAAESLKKGVEYIDAGISLAFAKATGALQNAVLGVIGDLPGTAEKRYQLAVKQLDSENNLLKIQLDLIKSNREIVASNYLRIAKESESVAVSDLKDLSRATGKTVEQLKTGPTPEAGRYQDAQKQVKEAEQYKGIIQGIGTSGKSALNTMYAAANAGNKLVKDNFKELADYALQVAGIQAQQLSNADKKAAEAFNTRIAKIKEESTLKQKGYETERLGLETTKQELELGIASGKLTEKEGIDKLYENDIQLKNNQLKEKQLEIDTRIKSLEAAKAADPTTATAVEAEIKLLEARKKSASVQTTQGIEAGRLAVIDKTLKAQLELMDFENKMQEMARETRKIEEDTAISLRDIKLETAEQTGLFSEDYLQKLKQEAQVSKIVEEAKRKEATTTYAYKAQQEILLAKLIAEAQKSGGESTPESERIGREMGANTAKYITDINVINSAKDAYLQQASAIDKATQSQNAFNSSLNALKAVESVFPAMGTAVSGLVSALYDATSAQEKYNKSRDDLNKKIDTEEDPKKKLKLTEDLATLDRKRAKDEVSDNARLMGSVKTLFKEKTTAYKVFGALEKALHVTRLAMDIKELLSKVGVETGRTAAAVGAEGAQTAAAGAGFLSRAGLYVTEIFSKVSAQLGIFGPPVAAAIIAAIGLSAFGGGGKSTPPAGFSQEDQDSVEGTGRQYKDGRLVTRAGALAEDPTAQGSSVSKSLEIVSANSFQDLEYSNKMVDALKLIEQNTRGLSSAMMRSLSPDRSTSLASGIPQGTLRKGYLDKPITGAAAGAGLGAGASMLLAGVGGVPLVGGALGAIGGGLAGALSGLLLPGLGLLFAKPLGKLLGSIFGGKVTQTVQNFGIQVNGTLSDVVKGTEGVIEEWANVKRVTKGGWFRSDDVDYLTPEQEATAAIKEYVGGIFSGIKDTTIEAAKILGFDVSAAVDAYVIEGFKISSKDIKTSEDLAKAIEGETSIAFNAMVQSIIPQIEALRLPFEETGTTLTRLARETQVYDLALTAMGLPVEKMGSMMKTELADAFVQAAGSIEKFIENTNFFVDNFLTEAERLAPIGEKVTTSLQEVVSAAMLQGVIPSSQDNLPLIDTKEEFKDLYTTLRQSVNPAAAKLVAQLDLIAPGFIKLVQADEKTNSLRISLMEAEGDAAGALAARRKLEYDSMSKTDAAIQRRINALEDEKSAYDKLRSTLKETFEGLKTSINSLRSAQTSLLSGPDSFMSPEQRLASLRSQFQEQIQKAQGPLTTPEERKNASDAAQSAIKLSQDLKAAGDVLFASGQENVDLRAWIADQLGTTASGLESTAVGIEDQIKSIDAGTNILKSIDSTLVSVKTLWTDYTNAQIAVSDAPVGTINTVQVSAAVTETSDALNRQNMLQERSIKLLEQQLELQAEQLRSNAIAMKAQTDELNRAAEERRLAAEYAERNKPSYGYASGEGS